LLYLFFGGLTAENGARVRVSPFVDFEPASAETNQARVKQVAWSPDGQYLAFLVDAEADDRDGVWVAYAPPDGIQYATQLFRECPASVACTVDRSSGLATYNSEHFEWNSTSSAILISLILPDVGQRAFTIGGLGSDPTRFPPVYRYGDASWSWDGSHVLISGSGEDGSAGLRWVDPVTGSIQLIFDSGAIGLWLQDAVERPNGQIVALGSFAGAGSAMSLFDSTGTAITGQIGSAPPQRASWSPDRSAVLVVVNDGTQRFYVAAVDGSVREITESVAGALAVEWINDVLPPSSDQGAPSAPNIPQTPEAQSQFGLHLLTQVQVVSPDGLNVRTAPSLNAGVVDSLFTGEYVVIVAGPQQRDGIIWWQVQTATDQLGWVAESINGVQLLGTPVP
jgi:dipeptidyl aminopeptidase/acylaminoacyl peptidase